jgi:hypothetical protein
MVLSTSIDLDDFPLLTMVPGDSSTSQENSEGPTPVTPCPSTVDVRPCPSTRCPAGGPSTNDVRQATPGSSPFFLSFRLALPNTNGLHRIFLDDDPAPPPPEAPPGQVPTGRIVLIPHFGFFFLSLSAFQEWQRRHTSKGGLPTGTPLPRVPTLSFQASVLPQVRHFQGCRPTFLTKSD